MAERLKYAIHCCSTVRGCDNSRGALHHHAELLILLLTFLDWLCCWWIPTSRQHRCPWSSKGPAHVDTATIDSWLANAPRDSCHYGLIFQMVLAALLITSNRTGCFLWGRGGGWERRYRCKNKAQRKVYVVKVARMKSQH